VFRSTLNGGHRIITASNLNAEPGSGAAQTAGAQEGFSRIMNKLYFNYSDEYTQFLAALTEFLVAENTGCLQKNGAVSKIIKKFISHLTWAKRTPSAATTVQVFQALIIILQCVHPGSHGTHPHDNRIRPILYVYVVVSICSTSDPVLLENTIE
jgi:hypothetical protein